MTGAGVGDGLSPTTPLPYAEQHLDGFEQRFCYDRFWAEGGAAPNTRYLCSGLSLVVVGDARSAFYRCRDRGVLAQFRHQHFLLFLIAHFQKATLLMTSDRLAEALMTLDIDKPSTIKRFKRQIRASFVAFLSSRTATGSTRSANRRMSRRCSTCAASTCASTRCTTR